MAHRDPILGEKALHLLVEIEQPHAVRDGGAALADLLRDVLLPQTKLPRESRKRPRFFDRVEVLALEVLDEGQLEDILIRGLANDDGRVEQAEAFGGAPAALAGDEFERFAAAANDQRLNDAVLFDRGDQFVEVLLVKDGARLEWRGHDLIQAHELHPLAAFDSGSGRGDARIDQRAETFAESDFCHRKASLPSRVANANAEDCRRAPRRYGSSMLFEKTTEVLDPEPHDAALNMAIDEVLLRAAREPLLRIYRWARPAISFGYFEKISGIAGVAPGWELVRRWTGGGVVRHGEDVTYTLIVPADHEFARLPAGESYRQIHGCVGAALLRAGVESRLASGTMPKRSSECFENPAEADVLVDDRKVAGAAQRRTRWGLLHQGSIQRMAISETFRSRLAHAFAEAVTPRSLAAEEITEASALAGQKYATDAWLRRF